METKLLKQLQAKTRFAKKRITKLNQEIILLERQIQTLEKENKQQLEQGEKLTLSITKLQKEKDDFFKPIGKDCKKQNVNQLSKTQIEECKIMSLPLPFLRTLDKHTLILIFLQREAYINEQINKFENQLKHNDREIFKIQKKEVAIMHLRLMNKDMNYQELQQTREKLKYTNTLLRKQTAENRFLQEKIIRLEQKWQKKKKSK